ncbi:P-loop containing nucleoside triphosphate hydrolase protein [Scleroderma citrinum]
MQSKPENGRRLRRPRTDTKMYTSQIPSESEDTYSDQQKSGVGVSLMTAIMRPFRKSEDGSKDQSMPHSVDISSERIRQPEAANEACHQNPVTTEKQDASGPTNDMSQDARQHPPEPKVDTPKPSKPIVQQCPQLNNGSGGTETGGLISFPADWHFKPFVTGVDTITSMGSVSENATATKTASGVKNPLNVDSSEKAKELKKSPHTDVTVTYGTITSTSENRGTGSAGPENKESELSAARSMVTSSLIQEQRVEEFEEVDLYDLVNDDVIIAIMGPTGAGKSSFISKVTGKVNEGVGHMLTSYTSEIKVTKCGDMGFGNVVLVDTPGFDDTKKSDLEILDLISKWLNETYGRDVLVSAILYFHRITDNRMAGTPLKNLRVFQKLCGEDAMAQVILVTTMWDEVDEGTGAERLKELESNYWKGMISRGSTTFRYENTPESAKHLLEEIAKMKWNHREVLLQQEISEMKKELRETAAGQVLSSQLEQLADQRLQALKRLRAEKSKSADPRSTEELRKEYADLKTQLDDTLRQVNALKLPRFKRSGIWPFKIFGN